MTAAITERQIRLRMQHIIDKGGDVPIEQASWYASELDRHGLDVVWLAKESARNPRIKSLLRIKGFERVAAYDWHQIYRRARPTSLAQAELVARRACKVAAGGTIVAPFGVAQALAAQRCASNLMAPSAVLARPAAELDELMRIERLTFVGTDLPSSQIPWLRSALERHSVSVVVIGPAAAANKNVRLTLGNLGMARVALLHGHSVFAATEGP